ncbi:MAG: DHHW family protein [Synergistaceae bacterium]|nr:DHHW family protein [Synergistaceae bacterium]
MKFSNKMMMLCFGILIAVMGSIFIRALTAHILVDELGVDNIVTQIVLFDNDELRGVTKPTSRKEEIDWAKQYPFEVEHITNKKTDDGNTTAKIAIAIDASPISKWTGERLLMYKNVVFASKVYDGFLKWNVVALTDYNGVVEIQDGQLVTFLKRGNIAEKATNIIELANFCKNHDIGFLYVNAPNEIGRNDNTYKGLDFSNENANEFLANLKSNTINYIDIRDNVEQEGLVLPNLFFRTDHHWLPETGLWATGIIVKYLNDNDIIKSNISLLNPKKYYKKVYKNWFLGSRGKKLTLLRTTPDDISLIYPNFKTRFRCVIPEYGLDTVGNFSVMYDKRHIEVKDYYNKNPYSAYCYGLRGYIHIENLLADNEKKILLIRESFANVVAPFLATQCKELDILDLRIFDGSVRSFIKEHKPDIVIVLYCINDLFGEIYYKWHNNVWDFR